MRKNAKYVFSTVLALFLSVTTVSCSKDETKRKELGEEQIKENYDYSVGEFDGFSYASWRANAVYRTLENMVYQGIITESDYRFCKC